MTVRQLADALLALAGLAPVERERECVRLAREAKGTLAAERAAAVRDADAHGITNAEFARLADIAPAQISRLLKENPAAAGSPDGDDVLDGRTVRPSSDVKLGYI